MDTIKSKRFQRSNIVQLLKPDELGIELDKPLPLELVDKLFISSDYHKNSKSGVNIIGVIKWIKNVQPFSCNSLNQGIEVVVNNINDILSDDNRQKLKELIPFIIDTAGFVRKSHLKRFRMETNDVYISKYKERVKLLLNSDEYRRTSPLRPLSPTFNRVDLLSKVMVLASNAKSKNTLQPPVDLIIDMLKDYSIVLKTYIVPYERNNPKWNIKYLESPRYDLYFNYPIF